MSQHQQRGDIRQSLNVFIGLSQCLAYLAEVWLRQPGTCGSRYFNGRAFIAWCGLFVIAAFGYSDPLFTFWAATGVWFLVHKVLQSQKQRKGYRCHSQYIGVSLLSVLGGNRLAYRLWEPLATFIAGLVLVQNGYGYGGFVMLLGVCLMIAASFTAAAEKAQITAIEDARVTQECLAEYMQR